MEYTIQQFGPECWDPAATWITFLPVMLPLITVGTADWTDVPCPSWGNDKLANFINLFDC